MKWSFKLHDVDENGIIDPSETFEVVKAIHAMSSTDPTEEEKVIVQQLTGLPSSDQSELIADRFAEISMNPSILKTLIFHTQVLPLFEPHQVYEKIKRMKKKASTVTGDIPWRLILEYSVEFSSPLCNIYNSASFDGVWPDIWKVEYVTPAQKIYPPNSMT